MVMCMVILTSKIFLFLGIYSIIRLFYRLRDKARRNEGSAKPGWIQRETDHADWNAL